MLQQKSPDDYVVGTGQTESIKYFVQKAFEVVNLKYEKYLKINKKYFRPAEVELLLANSSKINKKTGWKAKTGIDKLIEKMVLNDLKILEK